MRQVKLGVPPPQPIREFVGSGVEPQSETHFGILRRPHMFYQDHTVLPATERVPYLPLLPNCRASPPIGQYSLHLSRRDGQAELTWVVGYIQRRDYFFSHLELNPDTVTHPSANRARRLAGLNGSWHFTSNYFLKQVIDGRIMRCSRPTTVHANWLSLLIL